MRYGTILIVDDDSDALKILDLELSSEGFQVVQAKSGQDAFVKAKSLMPDLILMDVMMPDINGGQAIQMLKSTPKTKEIPVIFLTAMLTREEQKLGNAGVTINGVYYPTIAKPFNATELLMEVDK